MAFSIVSDLVVGFSSLFRMEVLGGRDHFLVGYKAKSLLDDFVWPMSLSQVHSY